VPEEQLAQLQTIKKFVNVIRRYKVMGMQLAMRLLLPKSLSVTQTLTAHLYWLALEKHVKILVQ